MSCNAGQLISFLNEKCKESEICSFFYAKEVQTFSTWKTTHVLENIIFKIKCTSVILKIINFDEAKKNPMSKIKNTLIKLPLSL